MRMYKRKASPIFEPILYVIIAALGIIMIVGTIVLKEIMCKKYDIYLSIMSDIGVGFFPTGMIGFILATMQNKNREAKRYEQRSALFAGIEIALHNYINTICETYSLERKETYRLKKLLICVMKESSNSTISVPLDEIARLRDLSAELENFIKSKNTILVSELFSNSEFDMYKTILNQVYSLINICDGSAKDQQRKRETIISCIIKLLKITPELKRYLNYRFINHNIQ